MSKETQRRRIGTAWVFLGIFTGFLNGTLVFGSWSPTLAAIYVMITTASAFVMGIIAHKDWIKDA